MQYSLKYKTAVALEKKLFTSAGAIGTGIWRLLPWIRSIIILFVLNTAPTCNITAAKLKASMTNADTVNSTYIIAAKLTVEWTASSLILTAAGGCRSWWWDY